METGTENHPPVRTRRAEVISGISLAVLLGTVGLFYNINRDQRLENQKLRDKDRSELILLITELKLSIKDLNKANTRLIRDHAKMSRTVEHIEKHVDQCCYTTRRNP